MSRFRCGIIPLVGLFALGACADQGKTDSLSETRGPLTVDSWAQGNVVTADVSISATGERVATFTCDEHKRTITTEVAATGDRGVRQLPTEAKRCDTRMVTDLAFIVGNQYALDSGQRAVPYDEAGCDGIGGDSACCARHDACYAAYDCSAWSWLYLYGNCVRCNNEVMICLAKEVLF